MATDRARVLGYYAPPLAGWNVTVRDVGGERMTSSNLLVASEYLPNPISGFENVFLLPFYQEGEFVVEFRYEPRSFWVGALLSFLGWVIVILYACGVPLSLRRVVGGLDRD